MSTQELERCDELFKDFICFILVFFSIFKLSILVLPFFFIFKTLY